MKKIVWLLIALIILVGGVIFFNREVVAPTDGVTDEREVVYTNASADMIVVDAPESGSRVTSPLEITGTARGYWYFEAVFPITLVAEDGSVITEGYATAQNDWMTEDMVPFAATLTFTVPTGVSEGTLILKNDNPSALPENDRSIEISVVFGN